jgi:RNA polymerase sigma factor (sigma-70 family)
VVKNSTRRHEHVGDVRTDAELLQLVRDGDDDAFGELYRRHIDVARAAARSLLSWGPEAEDVVADAFMRVLSILQRGGGPEEAFRPYLLTCVRHACYDRSQGIARALPVDPGDMADLAHARQRGELDPHDTSSNSDLLAQAFASLPERWQLVLWSTEVDGRRPAELAKELGLAPGAVASLAYRAREGLTEAFLSAHLQRPAAPACAAIRPRLAAFVRDNVSGREEASIQGHLDDCLECQGLVTELRELNRPLRGLLVPAVVGVPASAYLAAAATGGGALVPRLLQFLHARPVFGGAAAASVAVLAGATLTGVVPLKPTDAPPVPTTTVAVVALGAVVDASPVASVGGTATNPGGSSATDPGAPPPVPGGPATPAVGGANPAVPSITVPGIPGAEPTVTVPGVAVPGVTVPAVTVPAVTVPAVGVPAISLPPVSLPAISLPAVSLPPVSLPPVSLPAVSLPPVSVPPLQIPGLPSITLPVITVPVVTAPVIAVPVITVPVITVPAITLPVITVPPVTLPALTTPTLPR